MQENYRPMNAVKWNLFFSAERVLLLCGVVLLTSFSHAHPLPEIPVWAFFEEDGTTRIEIEVDPRCFEKDPEKELYMLNWYLQRCDGEEKKEMLEKAKAFIPTRIAMLFDSAEGIPEPVYTCSFTKLGGEPLKKMDDPVVIRAVWKTRIPESAKTYQVKAKGVGIFSVIFLNHINDRAVPRIQTLFPGEESYVLDLPPLAAGAETQQGKVAE
ncbi:MAG: hypothetical protein P1U86_15680 [Verrucomicrobiales bacterium]|nr:hypothetical protein [Verrucomicrobiales bacterium]